MRPPFARSAKIERLQAQLELLRLVRSGHLQWLRETNSSKTRLCHLDIAELMEQTVRRYEDLLKSLENQD